MATAFELAEFLEAPALEQAQTIAKGLPAKALRDLVADRTVSLADVARVVAPRRTIDRRLKDDTPLSPEESDRFARFAMVIGLAGQVLGSRAKAMEWLVSPKHRLDGERPITLLKSDVGTRLIEEILLQARHGFAA